jgi:hypothetical protein
MPSARPRRSVALAAVFAACAWLSPGHSSADQVSGTRSERLVERDHVIHLHMDHGHARMTVRRTVHNGGKRHDQAVFWIDVPTEAVATGLRTLGKLRGRPHWFAGTLMDAEIAAERYRELTGIGGYYPKDPALLSWRDQETLALQVFPVAPTGTKTIEYTLEAPAEYRDGRYHIELPPMGTNDLAAELVVDVAHRRDQVFVGGEPVGRGRRIRLDGDESVEIAVARHDPPRFDGGLASVPFADGRVLVHFDMAAAPRISEIPRNAHIVVVIDTSRSIDQEDVKAAVAAARAYLAHFAAAGSGTRVEVLTFDREVHARHGKMVPAGEARAGLRGLVIKRRNGSAVDQAVARAAALLAKAPRRSPRRLVVLTDLHTRSALTPARLRAAAGLTKAVVHVGVVYDGAPDLERDDDDAWAVVPRATGGVLWRADASPDPARASEMRQVYEEWARPVRLDYLSVQAPGYPEDDLDVPSKLDEGQGLEGLVIAGQRVPHVKIEGELWSKPVREVLLPSRTEGRLWSALVFGTSLLHDLSDKEIAFLAFKGRAVSPMTSYLAIEPGVRPSTEGLEEGEAFGVGGLGLIGTGRGGGGAAGGMIRPRFDKLAFLRDRVRSGWKACGGDPRTARVALETTFAEIVDITAVKIGGSPDPILTQCLTDAVWEIELPSEFRSAWQAFDVAV